MIKEDKDKTKFRFQRGPETQCKIFFRVYLLHCNILLRKPRKKIGSFIILIIKPS